MGIAQSTLASRLRQHVLSRSRSPAKSSPVARSRSKSHHGTSVNPAQERLISENRGRPDYSAWITHNLSLVVHNRTLFSAPVQDVLQCGAKVLGFGTSIGPWLLDAAKAYPNSSFTGLELPNTPVIIGQTANLAHRRTDTVEHLPFASDTFDFVVVKNILLTVTKAKWDAVIAESIRILKPGGWLEIHEYDLVHTDQGPKCQKVSDICTAALFAQGIDVSQVRSIKDMLEFSGRLVNVTRKDMKVCFNRNNKVYGPILRERMRLISHEVSPLMCEALNLDSEQFVEWTDKEIYTEMEEYGTSTFNTRVYGQCV